MLRHYAIIVAGGIGSRMGSETPKQFLLINGRPIIVETILKFIAFDPAIQLVIVLPKNHLRQWEKIKLDYFADVKNIREVVGGRSRTESVRNGLDLIGEEGLVAIHDAVRPYIDLLTIKKSYQSAEEFGSGVASVSLKDSIREKKGETSIARDRANYVIVQTPQTFSVSEIKEAYAQVVAPQSDDATVYELAGFSVRLIEGSYANIKITTPEDFETL